MNLLGLTMSFRKESIIFLCPSSGNLSGEECHELAEKYFETHKGMTLPGQALRVDLRPAFRKPLADVTPKFRAVSIGYTFTPQR